MPDILGPANIENAVTNRPQDTRTFSTTDTWLKDCSAAAASDGTPITAALLNGFLAQLRNLWRGNGKLADGATAVVAEVGTDDFGILKSIQQLFQRGQPVWAVDAGGANALVVSLSPALKEYKAGVTIRVKVAANNTGATTINVNGLGARAIKNADGTELVADDLYGGGIAELIDNGTNFQLVAKHTDRAGVSGGGDPGAPTRYRVPYTTASGTAAAIVATYDPATPSPVAGDLFSVKLTSLIAGATTMAPDGHGPYPVVDASGNALLASFAGAGDLLVMEFDGAKLRVLNKFAAQAGLMEPGAIGSIGLTQWNFQTSSSSNTFMPSAGYVYGAYIGNQWGDGLVGDKGLGPAYTGVWRILSVVSFRGWGNGDGQQSNYDLARQVALCQRIS